MEEALKRVRANSAGLSSEHNRSPPAADRSLGAAPAPPSAPAPAAESEDYEGRISAALTDSGRRLAFCRGDDDERFDASVRAAGSSIESREGRRCDVDVSEETRRGRRAADADARSTPQVPGEPPFAPRPPELLAAVAPPAAPVAVDPMRDARRAFIRYDSGSSRARRAGTLFVFKKEERRIAFLGASRRGKRDSPRIVRGALGGRVAAAPRSRRGSSAGPSPRRRGWSPRSLAEFGSPDARGRRAGGRPGGTVRGEPRPAA